jgi:iron(III) transport system ATP-binding protein
MAQRIVVMKEGVIEQIGTPSEVYGAPATPFVADFVGRTNLLPATCVDAERVLVGSHHFRCGAIPQANGAALRLFFRPEDVMVRGVNGATPNAAEALVEKIEFLGAYSRVTLRMEGIGQALTADLSMNDMAEFQPRPGTRLRIAVPADRLRVFAA